MNKTNLPVKPSDCGVFLKNVVADWTYESEHPNEHTLNDITFDVRPGELLVIVGR